MTSVGGTQGIEKLGGIHKEEEAANCVPDLNNSFYSYAGVGGTGPGGNLKKKIFSFIYYKYLLEYYKQFKFTFVFFCFLKYEAGIVSGGGFSATTLAPEFQLSTIRQYFWFIIIIIIYLFYYFLYFLCNSK